MAVSAAWIGAAAAVGGVAQGMDTSRRAQNTAKDQQNATAQADVDAANNANAKIKMQRQAMSDNSLLTGGGSSAAGRTTLGV